MNPIIDFHTHAFPDRIAASTISALETSGTIKAFRQGTVAGLLQSMDRAGIEQSVICSIATKPEQFQPILDWSLSISSSRIIPFPSIHPADLERVERVEQVHAAGLKGIKMHPYYQDYFLDDPELAPLYAKIAELGLLLVVHNGFDIAYPRIRRTDPKRILSVVEQFPQLRLIATHFGGWDDWDEAEKHLVGKPLYMEISFVLDALEPEKVRALLLAHPQDYLLFGTDSPWLDQKATVEKLQQLQLPDELYQAILWKNGARLLEL
ncbi:MAG: amidohydrolase [Desulfobulbus propionicus]|nr:MAG: amidohydrolase [Desulfobulbus propionicus]